MRSFVWTAFALAFIGTAALSTSMAAPPNVFSSIDWEISETADTITWVEIYRLPADQSAGFVHVEVMTKKKKAPPWEFSCLYPHIAVTPEALQRSVIRPLKMRSVYPETFEGGLDAWRKANAQGVKDVCTTSLQDYFKQHP